MRVLFVTHRFLPRYLAGTEVYTSVLGQGLKGRGHTVQIFTGDPSATQPYHYDWQGMSVDAVPWRAGRQAAPTTTFLAGFLNPPVERRFAQICAEFKPDIVHIHHLIGLSPRLPAIGREYGGRILITLHDYWFECSNTFLYRYTNQPCPGPGTGYHCGGCALQRLGHAPNPLSMILTSPVFMLRTAVLRQVLQSVDRVIVPSHAAARVFEVQKKLSAKLSVVPHGLSDRLASAAFQPRTNSGPLQLLYIGSLIRPKGVHIVLEALAGLPERAVEFHVYGDLSADPAYVAELRRSVTQTAVFFHGPLERPLVPDALHGADLVLVPTLWRETFSVIVDEAFEAGVPVLVSAGGAAAERVVDGVNGLVASAGSVEAWRQQLVRVVAEPGLLARLRAGIGPPKTIQAHVIEIEALYERALREAA